MTKKITDLEGRLDAALNRADSIPHEISLTRAELQEEWDKSFRLVERLTEAVKTLAEERDQFRYVVNRLAALNRDAGEIGAGMLASLVDDANFAISSVEKSVTNPSHKK